MGALTITVGSFLAYIGVQWWASWYPGAEPGGGGYVAQRMMSAKDEKQSIYATLFFQVAHYCIRPWPWILVGLATIVLYPHLGADEKRTGYVMAMKDFLPNGFKGMLIVAFLAAYMSTISTQLNWGASYIVNDLYKRFFRPENTFGNREQAEKRYVFASRLVTLLLMLLALVVTPMIGSISGVWTFIIECGAGLGLVLILRWYWWRINAWSEITATLAPFAAYAFSKFVLHWEFPNSFFVTVGFTTAAWLVVTYATKPSSQATLQNFYTKVRPEGAWGPVAQSLNIERPPSQVLNLVVCWLSAVSMTYSTLFFTGKVIFGNWQQAGIWGGVAVVSFLILKSFMGKTKILE
jgi:Na+/proline symporter